MSKRSGAANAKPKPKTPVSAMLLEEVAPQENAPLFRSLSDLGRAVKNLSGKRYSTDSSAISFVRQAIYGNVPFRKELRDEVVGAIRERISRYSPDVQEAWLSRFNTEVDLLAQRRKVRFDPTTTPAEPAPKEINKILVIAASVGDAMRTPQGRKRIRLFLTVYGLDRMPFGLVTNENKHHIFCFSSRDEARAFWKAAVEESLRFEGGQPIVTGNVGIASRTKKVVERLKMLESDGYVSTYLVHAYHALTPVALYNLDTSNPQGRILLYEGNEHQDPVPIPKAFLDRWAAFQRDLITGNLSGAVCMRVADFESDLLVLRTNPD